jgi:hypothetical protein
MLDRSHAHNTDRHTHQGKDLRRKLGTRFLLLEVEQWKEFRPIQRFLRH